MNDAMPSKPPGRMLRLLRRINLELNPASWVTDWRKTPAEAAPWRICLMEETPQGKEEVVAAIPVTPILLLIALAPLLIY